MATPEVERYADADELVGQVARRLLATIAAAQSGGRVPSIALTGGSIADRLHRELARLAAGSPVDWGRLDVWWGDDRFVAADSPDRNAGQARAALLDAVPVDQARVHEMPAADGTALAAAAETYGDELRVHGGGMFDVVMLGVGPDGHVASLFPGSAQLDAEDLVAVAVPDSPKPPPERISLTFAALNRSREVWFLVSGGEKADAVGRALAPGADRHDVPASGVQGTDRTLWFLDAPAASAL